MTAVAKELAELVGALPKDKAIAVADFAAVKLAWNSHLVLR